MGKVIFGDAPVEELISVKSEDKVLAVVPTSPDMGRIEQVEEQLGFTQSRLSKLIAKVDENAAHTVTALTQLRDPIVKLNERVMQQEERINVVEQDEQIRVLKETVSRLERQVQDCLTINKGLIALKQEMDKQKLAHESKLAQLDLTVRAIDTSLTPAINTLQTSVFLVETRLEKLTLWQLIRKMFS
jgi:predicted RNase H-like nuclease (RuvC/YqgF family)